MPDKYYSKGAIAERLSQKIKRPQQPNILQSLLDRVRNRELPRLPVKPRGIRPERF